MEVTFGLRSEWPEGSSYTIGGREERIPGRENSMCKGPETGSSLMCSVIRTNAIIYMARTEYRGVWEELKFKIQAGARSYRGLSVT